MARYLITEQNVALPDSGVVAGSYTNTDLTVNSQGIIVTAANGSSGSSVFNDLTDVTLTGPIADQIVQFDALQILSQKLEPSIGREISTRELDRQIAVDSTP